MGATQKIWKVRRDGVRQRYRVAVSHPFGVLHTFTIKLSNHPNPRVFERWMSDSRVVDGYLREFQQADANNETALLSHIVGELIDAVTVAPVPVLRLLSKIFATVRLDGGNYRELKSALTDKAYYPDNLYVCLQESLSHPTDSFPFYRMSDVAETVVDKYAPEDERFDTPLVEAYRRHARQVFQDPRPYGDYSAEMAHALLHTATILSRVGRCEDFAALPQMLVRHLNEGMPDSFVSTLVERMKTAIRRRADESVNSLKTLLDGVDEAIREANSRKHRVLRSQLESLRSMIDAAIARRKR